MKLNASLLACFLGLGSPSAPAQVFADFAVNLNGEPWSSFTAVLDHAFSPYTVANFIRLAEGLTPWVDAETGMVTEGPFYDGLEFYDGVPGEEVSTGSPLDDGRGGPGYHFQDDFRSAPTRYSLYMDNDGPNTNGSRFFINIPSNVHPIRRPGNYTRFGAVIGPANPHQATVFAISQGGNSGAYAIESVTMRYVGLEAANFHLRVVQGDDPILSNLPTVRQATFSFRRNLGATILDWAESPGSVLLLWQSPDLKNWIGTTTALNPPGTTGLGLDVSATVSQFPKAFFRGGAADYPVWPSTERPLAGKTIQALFADPVLGTSVNTFLAFDATAQGGTYSGSRGSGTFKVENLAIASPYATRLDVIPESGALAAYRLTLHHDLAWTSAFPATAAPVNANPSRLTGANLAATGTPLVGGQWTYSQQ